MGEGRKERDAYTRGTSERWCFLAALWPTLVPDRGPDAESASRLPSPFVQQQGLRLVVTWRWKSPYPSTAEKWELFM